MITLAIAGKPNCGKSTFYSAATLAPAEIADYPFTTIDANHGIAYVRAPCPCRELGRDCGHCTDGVRFIAVGMVDVAGLVPDAHKGRGLGNQFLDHLRQADTILHIIDASGSTDREGNPVQVGTHDPSDDIGFIRSEMTMWVVGILSKNWPKLQRAAQQKTFSITEAIADTLAGLSITLEQVRDAELELGIDLRHCDEECLVGFCEFLIRMSKPMLVVANKIDQAPEGFLEALRETGAVYATAAGELALRKATEGGFIKYLPGDSSFEIAPGVNLNEAQKAGLGKIKAVMERYNGTGIQQAINRAVFEILDMIVVYPVEDETHFSDSAGRMLPDAFLMKRGSTPHDLAYRVHTDIGDGFLYAMDARSRMRIREDYQLRDGDIIKIISTKR